MGDCVRVCSRVSARVCSRVSVRVGVRLVFVTEPTRKETKYGHTTNVCVVSSV
jgi:hypothetical protein